MATANASEGLRGSAFIKRASGWYIATAVVFIILGIFAIVEPGLAGLAVAFLVGWLLIFAGAAHLLGTFSGGGVARVIWQLILGVIYILGGLIWFHWPSSSVWAIGTLVGVNLMMTGISRLMLGTAARRLAKHTEAETP